jgi:DNA-binding GntR family transcriptional regulator
LSTILSGILAAVSEPEAYAALHAAIVAGELSPGERLVEEELAERLGESRNSVRGAILRLGHDGLVVRERNRGARVRRFTPEEAVEVLEARAALESLAAGYAAARRTEDEARELQALVEEMARLHHEGELLAMSERNALLHRRILEISRHRVARDLGARLHSQVVRFQFRTVLAPGRPRKSLAEHERIVAAIAAGDRDAAERAMREHLGNVAAVLIEAAVSAGA